MGKGKQAPLRENEHVRELLVILKENQAEAKELRELLGYVGAMERQLDAAVNELQSMRRELNDMREARDHPVATSLRNAVREMEVKVGAARERLEALKDSIVQGCREAVAAFKEKGISALNNLAGFFKLKSGLEALRDNLSAGMESAEKSIAKIESVSKEYHEIGKHVKNLGRAMAGKETVQDAKPVGKLAKALEAPFKSDLASLTSAKKLAEAAIGKLEKLERAAEKPSVLENIHAFQREQADRTKREAPAAEKQKRLEPSL